MAEVFTNADIDQPQRVTLQATIGNVLLVTAPPNARTVVIGTPDGNFAQWKDGAGVTDDTAIGGDFQTIAGGQLVSEPLPGTRGGVTRNLNGPQLAIAGEITVQVVELTFHK
jgi:hypothetical protein